MAEQMEHLIGDQLAEAVKMYSEKLNMLKTLITLDNLTNIDDLSLTELVKKSKRGKKRSAKKPRARIKITKLKS